MVAIRPLPSAAPPERRQSFGSRGPIDSDLRNNNGSGLYTRFTRKLSGSSSQPDAQALAAARNISALEQHQATTANRDSVVDPFARQPAVPRRQPQNIESFDIVQQKQNKGLQRKGSLLNKLRGSSDQDRPSASSDREDRHHNDAQTDSLKALNHLGIVPTKSPKAASVLTDYQRKDTHSPSSPTAEQTFGLHNDAPMSSAQALDDLSPGPTRLQPRKSRTSLHQSSSEAIAAGPFAYKSTSASPTNAVTPSVNTNGPALPSSKTLACAYIVGGLPKQPAHWTAAEHDSFPAHSEGALDRWWKPEVLGSSVVGEHIHLDDLDGRESTTRKSSTKKAASKAASKKGANSAMVGTPDLSPAEVAKIQAKALKLSFTRECEVLASTLAPPATSHYFSFTVPTGEDESAATGPGGAGQAFDLIINSTTARQSFSAGESTRYYAVSLQIWSHADKSRTAQIRQLLEGGQRKDRAHALKAASQGRRFGKKLEAKLASSTQSIYSNAETDVETDAFMSETDVDLPRPAPSHVNNSLPLWLPYHLILVSRWPLFDLLTDALRVHWARFNTAIAKHSLAMSQLLNTPAPRPGEMIKVSAGAPDVVFCAKMPGKMDIANEGFVEANNTCWPLFSCLSADNLLTICEVALSPMGRVIFFSRHSLMLSMAVETLTYILELKGWTGSGGVAHHQVHSRDIKLFVEDPGPYILGIHASCRSIAATAPREVLKVDLDLDEIECGRFYPNALSIGRLREKNIKTLETAIDRPTHPSPGVPREWAEAYPAGRFRPLSVVEANGRVTSAERLLPPSNWTFSPTKVFAAFDDVLRMQSATGFTALFKKQVPRRPAKLDPSAAHVQAMIRSHTATFVNRRDHMEAKLWKLNRRMASLATEAASWAKTYDTFSSYSKTLAKQQEDLKARLDKERREAKRLSAQVTEQKTSHETLQKRLKATEDARCSAERELLEASRVREELEEQRQRMIQELSTAMVSTDSGLAVSDDRPSSAMSEPMEFGVLSKGVNSSRGRSSSLGSLDSGFSHDGLDSEERAAMLKRQDAQEAMAQMQARLQNVLRMAKVDGEASVRSMSVDLRNSPPAEESESEAEHLQQPAPVKSKSSKKASRSSATSATSKHWRTSDQSGLDNGNKRRSSNGTEASQASVPVIAINGSAGQQKSGGVEHTTSKPQLTRESSGDFDSGSDSELSSTTTGPKKSKSATSKAAKRRSYRS